MVILIKIQFTVGKFINVSFWEEEVIYWIH
jgi:hypothetical protein